MATEISVQGRAKRLLRQRASATTAIASVCVINHKNVLRTLANKELCDVHL